MDLPQSTWPAERNGSREWIQYRIIFFISFGLALFPQPNFPYRKDAYRQWLPSYNPYIYRNLSIPISFHTKERALAKMTLFCQVVTLPILSQLALTASLPSNYTLHTYNNSLNAIQKFIWDFSVHQDHLEILINTQLPINPTKFTAGIDNALTQIKDTLREHGDALLTENVTPWITDGISIGIHITRWSVHFRWSDIEDVLQGLAWVLVRKKRFYETWFYVRTHEGVAFAEGMITAGELPWPNASLI